MRLCAIILVGAFASGCGRTESTATRMSLCELAENAFSYDGRLVEVSAEVRSDGIERTIIFDRHCPNSGAALVRKRRDGEDVAALQNALSSGRLRGTLDKRIEGTFVGYFRWHPIVGPVRTLELVSVRDVKVTPKVPPT